MNPSLKIAGAAVALACLSLTAHARVNAQNATPSLATCSVTDVTASADACRGFVSGNTSIANVSAMVSAAGWGGLSGTLFEYKDDTVATGSTGSTTFLFDAIQTSLGDGSLGQLTFSQGITGPFVLALKGGASWAGYYFDGTRSFAGGDVLSFDLPGVQGAGFSHAAIYSNQVLTAVPEAQTWAMLLAGLAAVGFIARRRQA